MFKKHVYIELYNEKRGKMKKLVYVFFAFAVLSVSFVSAGFFDDFFGKITGRAAHTADTNVSIGVVGTAPVIIEVDNSTMVGTRVDPTINGVTNIEFWVNVSDSDGVNDINDSSVNASVTFNATGTEAIRTNSSCVLVGDLDTISANFSCTINMYYFDAPGIWNITVSARDLGNTTIIYNSSQSFNYDQLQAIDISPTALTFASVSPGDTNITSNNDPTLINNTGNYNVTSGNLQLNATNLVGVSVETDFIFVANFSIDIDTGSSNETCIGGTTPVNNTQTGITGSLLTRGNNSLNNGDDTSGQEEIYYCITKVPVDISSQTYSSSLTTGGYGEWAIIMT